MLAIFSSLFSNLRKLWLGGLLLLAACGAGPGEVPPGTGAPLPALALTGLRDEAPTSTAALRGTPLVINFWATWCSPCRSEMPGLERLSRRLAAQGVRVIGITLDHDLNLAREFVHSHRLTFPIYTGGDGAFQSVLAVKTLPETLLVSAEGRIVARIAGARDWNGAEGDRLLERTFNLNLVAGR